MNDIFDFTLENEKRLKLIEHSNKINQDQCFELLTRLFGMYQFSGIKILENFIILLTSKDTKISSFFKLEASKSLFLFEELEEQITKFDDDNTKELKLHSNKEIQKRNKERKEKAYQNLNNVCNNELKNLESPIRLNSIILLMEAGELYKDASNEYFINLINDNNIDCQYRFTAILSLENIKNIDNEFYIKNACNEFLNNAKNKTIYRILAAQYLLKNLVDDILLSKVQDTILSFANDNELDYDIRADAADLLLNLGTDEYKVLGRTIIEMLGRIEGNVRTIYDNKQNVHSEKIEESVKKILEVLCCEPTMKIENFEVDFSYIRNEINTILKDKRLKINNKTDLETKDRMLFKNKFISKINCLYCGVYIGFIYSNNKKCNYCKENNVECYTSSVDSEYCSQECKENTIMDNKIKLSLNRIEMDRILYTNLTLSKILIKLWSYIQKNDYRDELMERLLEELEEMSGTCSSGFVSRLVNTLSGFSELSIHISFEDQLVSNFIGRLNSYTKKITELDSPFYNDKLYDVIELFILNNNINSKYRKNTPMKKIIDDYLKNNRDDKIHTILEYFSECVINEMMINTNKFNDKRHFFLFFRTYLPNLRQELWEEFKEYIDDFAFDLTIRKAISTYEGVQNFI
jgi:hypothetical protein